MYKADLFNDYMGDVDSDKDSASDEDDGSRGDGGGGGPRGFVRSKNKSFHDVEDDGDMSAIGRSDILLSPQQ